MASEGIIQEYVVEVKEHLQELEQSLLTMEREGTSKEGIGEIFRAAHSIKGAAAYMGFEHMANLTHGLESIIGQIQTRATVELPCVAGFPPKACGNDECDFGHLFAQTCTW